MKSVALQNEQNQIDKIIIQIRAFTGDPYFEALLAYYLCIRISGFLENCIRIYFLEYANQKCQDYVKTFMENRLKHFPNPTWGEIIKLIKDFNEQWVVDIKKSVSSQWLSSLESINNNRNNIAHGGTSSVTLHELVIYYQDIVNIIETIENICI